MTTTMTPGDRIGALHAAHAAGLLGFLIGLTRGERQTAEDLVQETMLRAWRHADHLPDDPEGARRWLYTVARRLLIDLVRARRSRPPETPVVDLDRACPAEDSTELAVATQAMLAAFGNLSDAHRDVLADLHLRGEAPAEVARKLRVPVGTVKSRAHYALRALRNDMAATD
ncbi:sigma-70 family RNA polymerase sigma factor [Actinoplanes sp. L3-i22]|uniref:sigma-70 family RNA polymerase sigma factor n=1 Tax=Actinoplanes sp. L3-i22 TaxID=2836373 RepID=UPI001C77C8F0|nr:sigma-70 family RNA polymerase sigma factor [Actinoplanes sp. L3-i22]BCY09323.1 RNA polymerase sigma factor SigL [Actinoplanes sp. L3-i22]